MKMQMEIRESLAMGTREMQIFLSYLKYLFRLKFECVLFERVMLSLGPPGLAIYILASDNSAS